jgi:uncharacterized membrane protein
MEEVAAAAVAVGSVPTVEDAGVAKRNVQLVVDECLRIAVRTAVAAVAVVVSVAVKAFAVAGVSVAVMVTAVAVVVMVVLSAAVVVEACGATAAGNVSVGAGVAEVSVVVGKEVHFDSTGVRDCEVVAVDQSSCCGM